MSVVFTPHAPPPTANIIKAENCFDFQTSISKITKPGRYVALWCGKVAWQADVEPDGKLILSMMRYDLTADFSAREWKFELVCISCEAYLATPCQRWIMAGKKRETRHLYIHGTGNIPANFRAGIGICYFLNIENSDASGPVIAHMARFATLRIGTWTATSFANFQGCQLLVDKLIWNLDLKVYPSATQRDMIDNTRLRATSLVIRHELWRRFKKPPRKSLSVDTQYARWDADADELTINLDNTSREQRTLCRFPVNTAIVNVPRSGLTDRHRRLIRTLRCNHLEIMLDHYPDVNTIGEFAPEVKTVEIRTRRFYIVDKGVMTNVAPIEKRDKLRDFLDGLKWCAKGAMGYMNILRHLCTNSKTLVDCTTCGNVVYYGDSCCGRAATGRCLTVR